MAQKATFGAGCFWGVEDAFSRLPGVTRTTVGYMGGTTKNPTYETVCSHQTGHAEVVQLEYDSNKISYNELLKTFWEIHNPTTLNRQGPDVGSQYRSVIFYHTDEQRDAASRSKAELEKSGQYERPIVTVIIASSTFYPAEEYHQKYYQKNGLTSCPI